MPSQIVPYCGAEHHYGYSGAVFAVPCTREHGHEGAHYGLMSVGVTRIACWRGDDRKGASSAGDE